MTKEHYKKLLNSFYGKWGQNGVKWSTVGRAEDEGLHHYRSIDAQTGTVHDYRTFAGLLQRRDTLPESRESHPAIAAHITAHARMVLWTFMRQMAPEDYHYCDTDSLLVSEEGRKKLNQFVSDERLGGLKLVGQFNRAILYGAKDYVLDDKHVTKGIRDTAHEIARHTFRQTRWYGFRGLLRYGSLAAPASKEIVKVLRRSYDKGIVGRDGIVFPFHLDLS